MPLYRWEAYVARAREYADQETSSRITAAAFPHMREHDRRRITRELGRKGPERVHRAPMSTGEFRARAAMLGVEVLGG
jgi:hypothetical protein